MDRPDEHFRLKEVDWIQGQIKEASDNGFYGSIVIKMENGRIRRVLQEKSIKPPGPEELNKKP